MREHFRNSRKFVAGGPYQPHIALDQAITEGMAENYSDFKGKLIKFELEPTCQKVDGPEWWASTQVRHLMGTDQIRREGVIINWFGKLKFWE